MWVGTDGRPGNGESGGEDPQGQPEPTPQGGGEGDAWGSGRHVVAAMRHRGGRCHEQPPKTEAGNRGGRRHSGEVEPACRGR